MCCGMYVVVSVLWFRVGNVLICRRYVRKLLVVLGRLFILLIGMLSRWFGYVVV